MAYTTIDNPELYFQVKTYSGAGGSQAQTLNGSEDMAPNMVWIKCRDQAENHGIYDTVRGAEKLLVPHFQAAETTLSTGLTAFGSDGFTVAGSGTTGYSGQIYVAWCWKAGTTSGITTNGSTTITPSAYSFNQTSGISIVKYTGNGTSGAKIAHGLGATPDIVIVKRLGANGQWDIVSKHIGASYYLRLSTSGAKATGVWAFNDTLPDSVNFTVGDNAETNSSDGNVAYCFSNKQGYLKCGQYYGNGSTNGTFVYTGFRPAMMLMKNLAGSEDWHLYDNKRANPFNIADKTLDPNNTNAEYTIASGVDFLSNGFKWRATASALNGSGANYIYIAFAEQPFVNSESVPCNAR
tara:strand:- start:25 stop:1077 length:1053 start_codon:yes stop_codon:yes gene_type:complete